jgi:hypothetical protein
MPADPVPWEFDVITALHDDIKGGLRAERVVHSRVLISAVDYPRWQAASEVAAALATAVHGGMPLAVLPRH